MTRELQLLNKLIENTSEYYWGLDDNSAVKVGNVETASVTFSENTPNRFMIEFVFKRDEEFSHAAPMEYSVELPEGKKIKELIDKVKKYLNEPDVANAQEKNEEWLAQNSNKLIGDLYNS